MIEGLKYCSKCVMPDTVEGQEFDKDGLCRTCQTQKQKKHIDWGKREKALKAILEDAKAKAGNNYDCIIPISGGKDSTWQLHVICKVYGLKALAVTFSHNWFSKTGWYNLMNDLEKFNVDHVMFTPNRDLVNKCAKRSLETIGDACWHCHAGVGAFSLKMAVAYKIPLIIWGESTAEHGRATYDKPDKFDRDYFIRVSAKLKNEQFACDYLSIRDLYPFEVPSIEECEGLNGIHLGDYIPWDTEMQVAFVKEKYGWHGGEIEGAYKDYKSVECSMAGMHDFLCYLKRGYGRTSIQASGDVRDYGMTREEAFELVRKYEQIEPKSLKYYLEITGLSPTEFREKIEALRPKAMQGVKLPADKEWRKVEEAGRPFMQRLIEGEV